MVSYRRQAINDSLIRTRGIGPRSFRSMFMGTRRMGAYAGTVSFPVAFLGTPIVMVTPTGGQRLRGGGTFVPIQVTSRASGSFQWFGSPRVGTFQWLAIGSYTE